MFHNLNKNYIFLNRYNTIKPSEVPHNDFPFRQCAINCSSLFHKFPFFTLIWLQLPHTLLLLLHPKITRKNPLNMLRLQTRSFEILHLFRSRKLIIVIILRILLVRFGIKLHTNTTKLRCLHVQRLLSCDGCRCSVVEISWLCWFYHCWNAHIILSAVHRCCWSL